MLFHGHEELHLRRLVFWTNRAKAPVNVQDETLRLKVLKDEVEKRLRAEWRSGRRVDVITPV